MVYICSPLRANETHTMEQNIEQAKRICRVCAVNGILGMAVHVYFPQFLDDTKEDERTCGIQHGITILGMCKEVWVFGSFISSGMASEIKWANANDIPVIYFKDIDEWLRSMENRTDA